ncbi:uncharacterized protein J3D65DRAFT_668643 [Phyllosticta citribraziliensis]|uniref:Uncharacterized protein n=1 Tax=Phyllosticta citribraziliensis TaxID=989973 RepID=A0ABR1LLY4_9PEZI
MVQPKTIRLWALTGGVAATVVMGSLYGAGLKTQTQQSQARKAAQEVPIEARIAGLEQQRAHLLQQKAGLDKKLAEIKARRVSSSNS